jgi:hypothetical protein
MPVNYFSLDTCSTKIGDIKLVTVCGYNYTKLEEGICDWEHLAEGPWHLLAGTR